MLRTVRKLAVETSVLPSISSEVQQDDAGKRELRQRRLNCAKTRTPAP
jgi:hypothetical protein